MLHPSDLWFTAEIRNFAVFELVQINFFSGSINSLQEIVSKLGCSKAYIITGKSLNEKTPVIRGIETILGAAHGGTYSKIGQHA